MIAISGNLRSSLSIEPSLGKDTSDNQGELQHSGVTARENDVFSPLERADEPNGPFEIRCGYVVAQPMRVPQHVGVKSEHSHVVNELSGPPPDITSQFVVRPDHRPPH